MARLLATVSLAVFVVGAASCGSASSSGDDAGPDSDLTSDSDLSADGTPADPDGDGDGDGGDGSEGSPEAGLNPFAVTAVLPNHGPFTGATPVVIRGRGFEEGMTVLFGGRLVDPVDVQVMDDNRVAVVSPPGDPGTVTVSVILEAGDGALLEDGYTYDSWYIDPSSGSTSGGTLVRLLGSGDTFQPDSTVSFDGQPAAEVELVSESEIICRTPAGTVGPADVAVESVSGSSLVTEAYVYYDSTDPLNGGLGGGPILGTIDVTVLDNQTRTALADAYVILGTDGATPYQGYTDETGKITFSGSDLSGRQCITASHAPVMLFDDAGDPLGEMTYESTTIVEFDAQSVTIFLLPIPPPQPGSAPPGRLGGFIEGELLFEHQGEFGPYEWQIIPAPLPPNERKAAFVYTSHDSIWSERLATGSDGTVFDTEEYRGTNGYTFRIYARPGAVAVYALAGIYNVETGDFQPYVMGVARGVVVGADETVSGVQVFMTRQLSSTVNVLLEGAPPPDLSGVPNAYEVQVYIDVGAEGVIGRPETLQRSATADMPFFFPGWTELDGNLSDASYTVVAGAWTVRAGSEEGTSPWSEVIRSGIREIDEDVVIDAFLGIPRALDPGPGELVTRSHMEWEAEGATPDFSVARLSIPAGLSTIPYWRVVLRGDQMAYDLPHLETLAEMPGHPSGDVIWEVRSYSVPAFDFDSWSYRYLAPRYWTAHAADGWFVRLSDADE